MKLRVMKKERKKDITSTKCMQREVVWRKPLTIRDSYSNEGNRIESSWSKGVVGFVFVYPSIIRTVSLCPHLLMAMNGWREGGREKQGEEGRWFC